MKDLERVLILADVDGERITGLGVVDRKPSRDRRGDATAAAR